MKSYFDKINGLAERYKLRIRYYPDGINDAYYVECKYKTLDKCIKHKTRINRQQLEKILNDSSFISSPDSVLNDFLRLRRVGDFSPFIRLNYQRQAFMGRPGASTRITLDSQIVCSRFNGRVDSPSHIPVLSPGSLVMEFKTRGYFPFWLSAIVRKYSLTRLSISKYVLAVQAMARNSSFSLQSNFH